MAPHRRQTAKGGLTYSQAGVDIDAGNALIALACSGAHSNGFSLIRRVAADAGLGSDDPAPFEPARPLGEIETRKGGAAMRFGGALDLAP